MKSKLLLGLVLSLSLCLFALWQFQPTTQTPDTSPSTSPQLTETQSHPESEPEQTSPATAHPPETIPPVEPSDRETLLASIEAERAAQVPPGTLRNQIQALPPKTQIKVLRHMRSLSIPEEDFPSLRVKSDGGLYYVNDIPPPLGSENTAAASLAADAPNESAAITPPGSAAAAVPVATPPFRHSRPGSTNVLYLDFNGHTVTGTSWNSDPEDADAYVGLAYDTDGDLTTFSDDEQSDIIEIWERVAEDFAPFDVDVTTEEPASFTSTTGRALITANVDANGVNMPSFDAGGVAQLGVFGNSDYATRSSPAFVYYNNFGSSEANIAEAVSHELGHNMGLSHDGLSGATYYNGHSSGNTSWGPIMGTGYGRNVSQWSKGEYFDANNTQDDFFIMQSEMGYVTDEAGSTTGTAAAATVVGSEINDSAIISSVNDTDVFSFSTATGSISFAVNTYRVSTGTHGGNGDLKLELLDSGGSVVATNAPSGDTNATLTHSATAGTYYVRISPDGDGMPLVDPPSGYTSYGSAGQYTLTGTIIAAAPSITSATTASVGAGASFSYTIVGTNGPTSYQATGLPTGLSVDTNTGIISGRATATGVFNIALSATNSLGTGNASLALTVTDAAPAFTSQTSGRVVVSPGDSPSLSATTVSANGTVTYQWQHNGLPISGATSATLNLSSVTRSAHGYYRVLATNTIGTTTSDAVFLIVAPTSTQVLVWGDNDEGQNNVPSDLGAVAQVSLGSEFILAQLRDGSVRGWGSDSSGQSTIPSGLTDVVQVATGSFHSIALKADGTVVGWGYDFHGQATIPSALTDVVYVAAGNDTSLAVKNDGSVVAWGLGNDGQATVPDGLTDVIAIATGDGHTIAAKADGSVVTWGRNDQGQTTVAAGATSTVAVSAGFSFSIGHQSDGTVEFWGQSSFGQQTLPDGLTTFDEVAAGSYHAVGRNADGSIATWGYNGDTQGDAPANLGQAFNITGGRYNSAVVRDASADVTPSISTHPVTQTVVEGTDVTLSVVAAGGTSILSYQWRKGGVNIDGATSSTLILSAPTATDSGNYDVVVSNQIGSITSTAASLTVNAIPAISAQSGARLLTTRGQTLSLSVTATGTGDLAYQWYRNGVAVSGATASTYSKTGFAPVDAGVYHATITDSVGTRISDMMFVLFSPASSEVFGWGENGDGQTTIPGSLSDAIAVTSGTSHSLALKADGTVVAWGSNIQEETDVPSGLTDVVKIAAGDNVSFALKSDGTLAVWGRPGFTIATPPAGLSGVVDIACYGFHALALKSDGTVIGWGSSGSGQLTIPTTMGTVVAIGAGSSTSYALNSTGTLFAWGSGGNGETTVPAASSLWSALSGGGFHAIALKSDGTAESWGFGPYGDPPNGLSGLIAISAGRDHGLGLSSAGIVTGWGDNDENETDIPSGLDEVFAVEAGRNFSLAIKEIQLPAAPAITSPPASQTVNAGASASFTVAASGFPAPTYQWRKDTVDISGATGTTYTINPTSASDAADYDVVATNASGSATSSAATLTVQTLPAISLHPQSQTITVGTDVTLTVTASGIPSPTYQWRKDTQDINGATSSSLALGTVALTDSGDYDVVITNVVGNVTSSAATITVQAAPAISGQPQSETVNTGADVTFTVTASGTPAPTYQWRKDSSPIDGATSASLQLNGVSSASSGSYDVVITNSVDSVTSDAALLTVQFTPAISLQPQSQTVNSGANVVLTVGASGVPSPTLQWRKDSQNIDGATGASLDLGAVSPGANGDYDVVVTNSVGSTTSATATVRVLFGPSINIHPASQTVTAGTSVTFTVNASGDPTPTYQWRKAGVDITGATNTSYTITSPALSDAADYDVVVTNSVASETSNATTLTVQTAPAFSLHPETQSVSSGSNLVLTATATGVPLPTLQWRKDGQNIDGATSASLDLGAVSPSANGDYDVVATNVVDSATSDAATITVVFGPSINTHPVDQTVNAGSGVTFTVSASGDPTPTYQWRKDGQNISGATSTSYTIASTVATDAADYDVVVTNNVASATSDSATLTVQTAPAFSTHPQTQSVNSGSTLVLTAAATGIPLPTLQWRKDGQDIHGATGTSLDLGAVSPGANGDYDVVATNVVDSATSETATITVLFGPSINVQPTSQTVTAGTSVTFTVTASGDPTPTYQWRKGGIDITGATADSFTIANPVLADAADYDVVVTNSVTSETSNTATLTVTLAPTISEQPASQTVTVGSAVTLSVTASGTPDPTYQWRKDGQEISGATNSSFNLGDVALTDSGDYDVVVTNSVDVVTSSVATLEVQEQPIITTQPISQIVLTGTSVVFTVQATGTPTPTFQWHKDGTDILGESGISLGLSNVDTSAAGTYSVTVTNEVSSVTSDDATLTIVSVTGAHNSDGYRLGGTATINNTVTYTGPLTKLVWSVVPPAAVSGTNWTLASIDGTPADVSPTVGAIDLLEWTWNTVPPSPFTFSYELNTPAATTGTHDLAAMFEATSSAGTLQSMVNPDPLSLPEAPTFHTADTDGDSRIDLSELLRVIELYNTRFGTTRTGRYKVDVTTDDGFAPDPTEGTTQSSFHAADINADSQIDLSELLRVIEIYNTRSGTTRTGEYHLDGSTQDGFAPGPES